MFNTGSLYISGSKRDEVRFIRPLRNPHQIYARFKWEFNKKRRTEFDAPDV